MPQNTEDTDAGGLPGEERVVIGHVSMAAERHVRLTPVERVREWQRLIAKLRIPEGTAYLPMPFNDPETMTVGLNLVGIPATTVEEQAE